MAIFLALVAAIALAGLYVALNFVLVQLLFDFAGVLHRGRGGRSARGQPPP